MSSKSRYRNTSKAKQESPIEEPWEPIRIDTSAPAVDEERFELFWIDDEVFTAPKRVPAGVALRGLQHAFQMGQAAAAWFILTETVGEEAMEKLYDVKQLTHEDVQRMLQKLGKVFWGQVEDMVGKPPSGQTS